MNRKIKIAALYLKNNVIKWVGWKPQVVSIDDTIDYILKNRCSVSRYGDGEFSVMIGYGNGFQTQDAMLSNRLREIIKSNLDHHIVCIGDIFGSMSSLKKESREFNDGLLNLHREDWLALLNRHKTYFNAFFTRPYQMFADKSNSKRWFEKCKKIWERRDLLIVEGEFSRLGVGNDLFAGANSVERILCPATNAFEKYDQIYNAVKKYGRDKLVLIALGMTATVLAFDVAKIGYWAIDIGHIDIEYEWYLRKASCKIAIPGKYVNEVEKGKMVESIADQGYTSQIILKI